MLDLGAVRLGRLLLTQQRLARQVSVSGTFETGRNTRFVPAPHLEVPDRRKHAVMKMYFRHQFLIQRPLLTFFFVWAGRSSAAADQGSGGSAAAWSTAGI